MEVSSHALDQQRIDGVRMRIAAFSNLSRDHLDYHETMERYADAKARLFQLPGLEHAVINVGDPVGARFAALLSSGVELTAIAIGGDVPVARRFIHVCRIKAADRGLELEISGHFGERRLRSPLIGGFNAENLAITLGVLLAWQFGVDEALEALGACTAPPGRMEGYRLPNGALAVVDYAHTPDALAKALAAVRAHARGRVLVVFGCGGERDPGKRALMGEAAERLADRVIVTDDNPRGEDAEPHRRHDPAGHPEPEARAGRARSRARDRCRHRRGKGGRRRAGRRQGSRSLPDRRARAPPVQRPRLPGRAQRSSILKGRLSEAAAVTGGRLAGPDAEFAGVSIDSRTVEPRQLFVALRGERFDGHAFVAGAAGRGAAGAIVEKVSDESCRRSSCAMRRRR